MEDVMFSAKWVPEDNHLLILVSADVINDGDKDENGFTVGDIYVDPYDGEKVIILSTTDSIKHLANISVLSLSKKYSTRTNSSKQLNEAIIKKW